MKRFISIAIITASLLITAVAQAQTLEEFMKQQQQAQQQFTQDYLKGVAESMQEYEEYKKKWEEEFEQFKKEQMARWGDFKDRTKKDWVEYKDGGKTRTSVDFEKGKGRVEVIAESPQEVEKAKNEMAKKLIETFQAKPTEQGFEPKDKSLKNPPVVEEPALKDQIASEGKSAKETAEKLASEAVKTKTVKGEDGKERTVVYVDFSLAPDHLRTRAEKVQDYVYKHAKEHELDPALVFAIIHSESYYNPTAKSHANAHGLMQLVPTSGGRDAYRAAFNKDGIPTPEFLYVPDNNVLLGSNYFEILNTRYFEKAKSTLIRDYLAICAYNTGAGNVARAYTGTTSVSKAMKKVNEMSEQENYDFLIKNLPYDETKNYLKKVHERRQMYAKWMKNPSTSLN